MKQFVIDGSKLNSVREVHLFLKEGLAFTDYYGMNLDALWDCLTGWVTLPLVITWTNFGMSEQKLGSFADRLRSVFMEAEQEMPGFKIEIDL